MSPELIHATVVDPGYEDESATWRPRRDANDRAIKRRLFIAAAVLTSSVAMLNGLRLLLGAALLLVVLVSIGYSQTPAVDDNAEIPDFTIRVWPGNVEDFNTRVWAYFDLRGSLEKGLVALTMTDDPAQIEKAESDLAGRLRVARPAARQGDFFTPPIERDFKKALIVEMSASTWAAIMDGNPGEFAYEINATYRRNASISTVPPNILALLPTLPKDIQYRFVGRHLILHDTRANVIIDRIPYAIRCADCDDDVE